MDDSSQDITLRAFKIILVGTQSVGKSSLLCRLVSSQFPNVYQATVGIDYHTYNQTINHKNYCLQIWDTAGQQKFRALTSTYYKNCNGCLCVYDVADRDSLQKCEYYLGKAVEEDIPATCTILVGNKIDLLEVGESKKSKEQLDGEQSKKEQGEAKEEQVAQSESIQVNDFSKEGEQMAAKYGIKHWLVSAKTGERVNQTFNQLTHCIIKHYGGESTTSNFQLLPKLNIKERKQNCNC